MIAGQAAPAPANRTRWDTAALLWGAVLLGALLLPVNDTARWLNAAYAANPGEVISGVWILKLAAATIAAMALLLGRVRIDDGTATPALKHRPDAPQLFMLGGIMLLALGLRLYGIDTELWIDEITLRTRYVPLEFNQLVSSYDSQNHQPLYSILARLSFLAFGGTDWSLRIPAVVLGVASLAALWNFGRRVTSPSEAMLGALVLAVSYHHVWFSQNARGYTTMMFLVVLGTHAYLRLFERDGNPRRLAWGYALAMSLATYTHLTAALIAIGHGLTLALTTRWTSPDARRQAAWPVIALVLSALLTILFYAPMLPQVVRVISQPTMEGVAVAWTGMGWLLAESVRVLAQGIPGGIVTVGAALAVLGVGVGSYWRQSRRTTLLMFLPLAITFVALVTTRHNLWPRFFFFASGFLVLAALRGGFVIVRWVSRWFPERIAVAGACAIAFLSLLTVPRAWQPKQQFRAAYEYVEQERRPGDEVVAVDVASAVYQLRGWAPTWRLTGGLATLAEAERSANRTWVVYTLPTRLRAAMPELFLHITGPLYRTARVFDASVGGGEIYILRHDSNPGHD